MNSKRNDYDITYHLERIADVKQEIFGLLPAQWGEVGHTAKGPELALGWYRILERDGKLFINTARDMKGNLVGYSICILQQHHQDGRLYAANDAIYVIPPRRGGDVAKRLIEYEKLHAMAQKASIHTISMKPHRTFSGLLKKLGYKPLEITFAQELK